jgi:molecular chaperone DnaK (HSP70)
MDTNNAHIAAVYKTFRGPWEDESKIVVGIDIGTTQSGVAFTYLQEGRYPVNSPAQHLS